MEKLYDLTPLIIMTGPTATGKTEISIKLAKEIKGEIISADSMQIYKYMNIGTAKPTTKQRREVPHHLISILKPNQIFSAYDFKKSAEKIIEKIYKEGRLPIVVGGTGFYISALINSNIRLPAAQVDWELRKRFLEEAKEKGNIYLYNKLNKIDPETAHRLHFNDVKRVIRALEVFYLTGKPLSCFKKIENGKNKYNTVLIGLIKERKSLYKEINNRVDKMVERGLILEVKRLMDNGYKEELVSMQGLGYKQLIRYFKGHYTLDEAINLIKRDTRRFAKRQITWWRRDKRVNWINIDEYDSTEDIMKNIKTLVAEKIKII